MLVQFVHYAMTTHSGSSPHISIATFTQCVSGTKDCRMKTRRFSDTFPASKKRNFASSLVLVMYLTPGMGCVPTGHHCIFFPSRPLAFQSLASCLSCSKRVSFTLM